MCGGGAAEPNCSKREATVKCKVFDVVFTQYIKMWMAKLMSKERTKKQQQQQQRANERMREGKE